MPLHSRSTRVSFVGDSITAEGNWRTWFAGVPLVNEGIPGNTTLDVLARLESIQARRPHTVLLMLGINDLLRGAEPRDAAARIDRIRRQLRERGGSRVVVQSTLACEPSACGAAMVERVRRLNQLLRGLTPAGDYLDVDAVLSDGSGLRRGYSRDGLHLNQAGYERWRALLRQELPTLWEPAPARPHSTNL
ncbi:MAG: GDSL-type esterase/lipase family protein [Synechococcaceae cyanobacterium]|nr:GDSL-type esterase/lipase family protein [Synechococcaceae cyanobacterium]